MGSAFLRISGCSCTRLVRLCPPGRVAIAGHRDSFFRPLQDVHVGDDIMLDTPEERVHYRVTFTRVVNSYDVGVIAPTQDSSLTLVTCYPFWFIGQAPDRFVVRA